MFEISWVDPTSETVGQRKSRKEGRPLTSAHEGAPQQYQASSIQSSRSTKSLSGQAKPSLLKASPGNTAPALIRIGSHFNPSNSLAEQSAGGYERIFPFTASSGPLILEDTARIPLSDTYTGAFCNCDADQSSLSGVSESRFSESTCRSVESTTSSRIVQALSPISFVTRDTEITVSSRETIKDEELLGTTVHIYAANTMPSRANSSPISTCSSRTSFDDPLPKLVDPERVFTLKKKASQVLSRPIAIRTREPDTWRAPDEWGCSFEEGPQLKIKTINVVEPSFQSDPADGWPCQRSDKWSASLPAEFIQLQRSVRRMEAASPKILLERLKEEWVDVGDPSVHRELESEKQLWMLTALRRFLRKPPEDNTDVSIHGITKVLSLYENQASTLSLLALTNATEVHQLSLAPLSPISYPNIRPLAVPSPSPQLPYASNNFTSIHAFNLPALFPGSLIPKILKECHRTLISESLSTTPFKKPPGRLHLTILDPSPLPATLGPRLRAWLDNNLIINLEKKFLCLNPRRLIPLWLDDAGLGGNNSTTISQFSFLACIPPSSSSPSTSNSTRPTSAFGRSEEGRRDISDGEERIDLIKSELDSVVGRMAWKEIWGPHVIGGQKWWWDDQGIVEECERMGTMWEYTLIETAKEG